jgi:hypothetical protein
MTDERFVSRRVDRRRIPLYVLLVVAALATPACSDDGEDEEAANPRLTVLSNDPRRISGNDALVEVRLPAQHGKLRVFRDEQEVTSSFTEVTKGRFLGVVEGLQPGDNELTAKVQAGGGQPAGASDPVTVRNHPISGPIFSGPHQLPFTCQTGAAGLGPPLDLTCSVPTVVDYWFWPQGGDRLEPLDGPPNSNPTGVRMTTTLDAKEVPYVVRRERGVINRSLYEFNVLYDFQDPTPTRDEVGWNQGLVMNFGGGCNVGYHQGTKTAASFNDEDDALPRQALALGFAVASGSFLISQYNCNYVTAGETAMMIKERFIERYGTVRHVIGSGSSGGAVMQYGIADAYPGILDGLIPRTSFADFLSNDSVPDCLLLLNYFANAGIGWKPKQKAAVSGFRTFGVCEKFYEPFRSIVDATSGCDPSVPMPWYSPVTKTGVRCSLFDHLSNQLGGSPATGFANRTFDNVGVQYGLRALQSGFITPAQFVDLNRNIGGFDSDGRLLPQAVLERGGGRPRTVADPGGLRRAYESGQVTWGGAGLRETPSLDLRQYTDHVPEGEIHTSYASEAVHRRIVEAGGNGRINARWVYPDGAIGGELATVFGLRVMDEWLRAIEKDAGPGSKEARAVRNRPNSAMDACWITSSGPKIPLEDDQCSQAYPIAGDTRTEAGGPIVSNVLKCRLTDFDDELYAAAGLTSTQIDVLSPVFPSGTCDYERDGQGQVPLGGTWRRY